MKNQEHKIDRLNPKDGKISINESSYEIDGVKVVITNTDNSSKLTKLKVFGIASELISKLEKCSIGHILRD